MERTHERERAAPPFPRGEAPARTSPRSNDTWKDLLRTLAAPALLACAATFGTPAPATAQFLERGSLFELRDDGPAGNTRARLTPPATSAGTHRAAIEPIPWWTPYSDYRLGIAEFALGAIAGRFDHEFSGTRSSAKTMLGADLGMYGSILGVFTDEYTSYRKRRLRVADYIRMDVGIGMQHVNVKEVASETLRPAFQTFELWIDLRLALGVQANLLVTRNLEIGGVAGTFSRWSSIWDADFDMYRVPSLRGVRLRYGNISGEYQTAESPVDHRSLGSIAYARQDTYQTLRLRYSPGDRPLLGVIPLFGVDVELWKRRLTRDGKPYVIRSDDFTDTDASHTGTTIRFMAAVSI